MLVILIQRGKFNQSKTGEREEEMDIHFVQPAIFKKKKKQLYYSSGFFIFIYF